MKINYTNIFLPPSRNIAFLREYRYTRGIIFHHMMQRIFLLLICFFTLAIGTLFAEEISDINVRDTEVGSTDIRNENLDAFIAPFSEFFFTAPIVGGE